ncbi:hypothetical protein CHS0354_014787 [Potamilus streckersoni]|uniref:Uncharacterized protein n=1 Tax=Potamilus streckersoni TaxID=2493646 RepID=A0AAE0VRV8_9BIVA|nr:hypothetical protein CHS0354_014787 [Potamilus streckersoni]
MQSMLCYVHQPEKSEAALQRQPQGSDRFSSDGCTCAKRRQHHLTWHMNNVHPVLGRMPRSPTMTEDAKLMLCEMAVLMLEKELNQYGQPHRNALVEKCNFLALKVTVQPKIVVGQRVRFMLFQNFCSLRDIVTSAENPERSGMNHLLSM